LSVPRARPPRDISVRGRAPSRRGSARSKALFLLPPSLFFAPGRGCTFSFKEDAVAAAQSIAPDSLASFPPWAADRPVLNTGASSRPRSVPFEGSVRACTPSRGTTRQRLASIILWSGIRRCAIGYTFIVCLPRTERRNGKRLALCAAAHLLEIIGADVLVWQGPFLYGSFLNDPRHDRHSGFNQYLEYAVPSPVFVVVVLRHAGQDLVLVVHCYIEIEAKVSGVLVAYDLPRAVVDSGRTLNGRTIK